MCSSRRQSLLVLAATALAMMAALSCCPIVSADTLLGPPSDSITNRSEAIARDLRGGSHRRTIALDGSRLHWTSEEGELRVNGHPFHLKGIGWYGLETGDRMLHGLEHRSVESILDWLAADGFNAIRLPFSLRMALHLDEKLKAYKDGKQVTARELIKTVVHKAAERGILVMLDMHRAGDDEKFELWYTKKYSYHDLKRGWLNMLDVVKHQWNVFAVDLVNEPNGIATWGTYDHHTDWRLAATDLALYIVNNAKDYHGLFFIQGVSGQHDGYVSFWGGNLVGVRRHPIDLTFREGNRRVVYSPHTYGPAVAEQQYFHTPDFPSNLPGIWDRFFGFVERHTGRAVVMGEWGGPLSGRNEPFEETLANYLISRCMSDNFYWCLNPGSGDTGGLLRHDWWRPFKRRQALLRRVQPHPSRLLMTKDGKHFLLEPGAYANPHCDPHK